MQLKILLSGNQPRERVDRSSTSLIALKRRESVLISMPEQPTLVDADLLFELLTIARARAPHMKLTWCRILPAMSSN